MPHEEIELMDEISKMSKRLKRVEKKLRLVNERIERQTRKSRGLEKRLDTRVKREEIVMRALGMNHLTKRGDRAFLGELNDSILRLQEYLLRTSERIDNILSAIKSHREYLVKMSRRLTKAETRESMDISLQVMRNTLWILAINGASFDTSLIEEIGDLETFLQDGKMDMSEIRQKKKKIEERFRDELKRFDLRKIGAERKSLPGYV